MGRPPPPPRAAARCKGGTSLTVPRAGKLPPPPRAAARCKRGDLTYCPESRTPRAWVTTQRPGHPPPPLDRCVHTGWLPVPTS